MNFQTPSNRKRILAAFGAVIAIASSFALAPSAFANDALIRQHLGERIPGLPKIDEIRPSGFPGMFEVRIGNDVAYTDAKGEYLIHGSLLRTADKRDLTQERLDDLQKVQFKDLPLFSAVVQKTGTGERKVAIFADPNCGYCKKFEAQIAGVPNMTVYTVLIPILSADSATKAQGIWCSKDRGAAWSEWMLHGKEPAKGSCAAPLQANLDFAKAHNITGTPTIFFEDGSRKVGAISLKDFEDKLASVNHPTAKAGGLRIARSESPG